LEASCADRKQMLHLSRTQAEAHLRRILSVYAAYYNRARPRGDNESAALPLYTFFSIVITVVADRLRADNEHLQ
jgi:hypothetical protein